MKTKNAAQRVISFKGELKGSDLRLKMQRFNVLSDRDNSPILLVFKMALGGDTAPFLELSHMIRDSGIQTVGRAYGQVNSNALLPFSSCTMSCMEIGCTALIHPLYFPPLAVTLFDKGMLPPQMWEGAARLQEEYRRMLISNCGGKLSLEWLVEMMSRNNNSGDTIDAHTALEVGIVDRLFSKRRVES